MESGSSQDKAGEVKHLWHATESLNLQFLVYRMCISYPPCHTGYEDSVSECTERAPKSSGTEPALMLIKSRPLGLMGRGSWVASPRREIAPEPSPQSAQLPPRHTGRQLGERAPWMGGHTACPSWKSASSECTGPYDNMFTGYFGGSSRRAKESSSKSSQNPNST